MKRRNDRVTENSGKGMLMFKFLSGSYIIMRALAKVKTETAQIEKENPYLEKSELHPSPCKLPDYERKIKPLLDHILSLAGLLILSPLFLFLSIAIFLDDPGPILFTQKRVGKDKKFFYLHKFRSMKMSTPHDIPTHQLENPEQYITRIGKFLRKCSLDGNVIIGTTTETIENAGGGARLVQSISLGGATWFLMQILIWIITVEWGFWLEMRAEWGFALPYSMFLNRWPNNELIEAEFSSHEAWKVALQELNSRMADRDGLIRFPPNFVVSVEQSLPEETSAEIYERIDVFGYIKN